MKLSLISRRVVRTPDSYLEGSELNSLLGNWLTSVRNSVNRFKLNQASVASFHGPFNVLFTNDQTVRHYIV
jgi:hypothetical protein